MPLISVDPLNAALAARKEANAWLAELKKAKARPAADAVYHSAMLVKMMHAIETAFRQKVSKLAYYGRHVPNAEWLKVWEEIRAFAFADEVTPLIHGHLAELDNYQTGARAVPAKMSDQELRGLAGCGHDFLAAIGYGKPGKPTGWAPEDLQWLLDAIMAARTDDIERVREAAAQALEDRPRTTLDQADKHLAIIRAGFVDGYKVSLPRALT